MKMDNNNNKTTSISEQQDSAGIKISPTTSLVEKTIKKLYDIMVQENLEQMEMKDKEFSIKLKRKTKKVHQISPDQINNLNNGSKQVNGNSTATTSGSGVTVKSPLNGVFYRASSPQSDPFVKEGDTVDPGKILCIIEAMKVMNEIRATMKCKINKILIENGKPVSAQQDLFSIEAV